MRKCRWDCSAVSKLQVIQIDFPCSRYKFVHRDLCFRNSRYYVNRGYEKKGPGVQGSWEILCNYFRTIKRQRRQYFQSASFLHSDVARYTFLIYLKYHPILIDLYMTLTLPQWLEKLLVTTRKTWDANAQSLFSWTMQLYPRPLPHPLCT